MTLTRAGLLAERATRAFWPLWSVLFVALAPLMFGWQDRWPLEAFWTFAVVAVLALIGSLIWGLRQFRWPTSEEATARLDASLPGRPISAVRDRQAIGTGDAASEAVWAAHVDRMRRSSEGAKPVPGDLRVSDRDPYGLRFIALLFFVCALLFGSVLRVGSVATIAQGGSGALASGPVWEGWVTPPAYTGKPTLYLNDQPAGDLSVPEGSEITLRLYGEVGALTVAETVSGRTADIPPASEPQQTFTVTQPGTLTIDGAGGTSWTVTVTRDQPPSVALTGPVESDADGQMSQPFAATDDYGVEAGTATIALDLDAVDRNYGLATVPDPIDPLVLDLPMPFGGDRADFEEVLIDDFSQHPLANLPVTITLSVTDAAGQAGASAPDSMTLPGRRFFQPLAKAVIEQRRDLMWSRDNAPRIARVLRSVSYEPEDIFTNQTTYLRLRQIIRRLETFIEFGMTDDNRAELVQAMWDLAIQLEDGTLADARERLRRAQERLEEAMRDGASDEEIAELMDELREATRDYMQMLADQMEPQDGDGTDQPDMSENSTELSQDQLQAMMDRIEELMQEGRMAEAQALMEQLNQMLENMRITQGQGSGDGPRTPGQQSMQDLADTLREQQDLSDDAFRDMQRQGRPEQGDQPGGQQGQEPGQGQQPGEGQQQGQGQQGQQGQGQQPGDGQGQGQAQDGQGGPDGQGLAQRQQALRDELNRQRGQIPGLPGDAGDRAGQSLDRAEGAMDGAEQALRDGDLGGAIDRQAEALDALRDGMQALGEALAQNEGQEPGQGQAQGEATGQVQPSRRDPLGRQLGNSGQYGSDENMLQGDDVYRRAEDLLNELRRRSGEQERPQVERDYLNRLLDRF